MRPHGREASSHDVEVTTSPIRTRGQIRRWRQYLADERSEAAGYRRLAERRTGEEREILLALADAEKRWDAAMAPYKGVKIVTYHRSWPNFADRFGLDVIGYVEPKPGIPPSPGHTLDLVNEMKRLNIKVIAVEPYFDLKTPNAVGRDTGAAVLVLAPSVNGVKEATDYLKLFDYNINLLVQTFQKLGVK